MIAFQHPFIHDFFLGERGQRAMELLREYPFAVLEGEKAGHLWKTKPMPWPPASSSSLITALLVALAAWLTRDTGERDIYEISTRETVTGLQPQAPVRYRGVDVGKVASIGFDPKTPGNVLMRLEVDREAPRHAATPSPP